MTMDTTNNDAAFWIAGYTDYLRDVVGAADTTRLRYCIDAPTASAGDKARDR
jgi:hypothetical protein